MIRAVIFDMFETLVTLDGSGHYGGLKMSDDAGVSKDDFMPLWHSSEDERTVGHLTTEQAVADILRELGVYTDELCGEIMRKRREAKERCFERNNIHPEVYDMLRELREKGIRLGLISNCFSEERDVIRSSEMVACFDAVMLSYEQGVSKPDREIFERCMKELGVTAEECLYVGDGGSSELKVAGELGMHPVQAAWYLAPGGIQPCGRLPGFRQADSPMDVLRCVEEGDKIRYCSWYSEIPEGDFVSKAPTYEVGKYFPRFHSGRFTFGDITLKYYWFDPREYGYADDGNLPLLTFLHGKSNALVGDICINYTGAELYASDSYQKAMGGAFILIPIANEYIDEQGRCMGTWQPLYLESAHALILNFIGEHTNGVGKRILLGNSAGATFTLRLMDNYMDDFDVAIPVGSASLAEDEVLDQYDEKGKILLFTMGRRDEFHPFDKEVGPRLAKLQSMKNCILCVPDWVRNGDHGIASIGAESFEMGQHCMMNAVQCNLMFDDGTPMIPEFPRGMTGWIADYLGK
ncbi:MAG: HAD-IA family hydrolase [Lachnospiraceae bacterium]|nr:HAD-IA family hydrolase [Lachnospiraceae bacterium]